MNIGVDVSRSRKIPRKKESRPPRPAFLVTNRLCYGVFVVSRLVVSVGSNVSTVVVAPTELPTGGNVVEGGVAIAPAVAPAAES